MAGRMAVGKQDDDTHYFEQICVAKFDRAHAIPIEYFNVPMINVEAREGNNCG